MREETTVKLVEMVLTAVATIGILVVLGFILFVAFEYFEGPWILVALAVELALLVLLYHLYRWFRYPGLFQSKSPSQLLFEVALSILFIYSLPLIAFLAKLHVAGFLPLEKIALKLGLEFKFKVREQVQVSLDAPSCPGKIGRIAKIRVDAPNDPFQTQFPTSEVIYTIRFADDTADIDIPEQHVTQASPFLLHYLD